MFRLEGEVFLFGTAIAAPVYSQKNWRRSAPHLDGLARGGGEIIAIRGPYSESSAKRKAGRSGSS
jgi:hypothetical protein